MAAEHPPEEQEEKGFVISDKRLFSPSGERLTETSRPEPAEPEIPTAPQQQEQPAAAAPPQTPPPEAAPPQDLPPVDFAAFVMMLVNNVMVFLGQVPNPLTQQPQVDLAQAKQTIDTIMMLREKTRGNLTAEEERFLQELLPQLQMAYVQARQQGAS